MASPSRSSGTVAASRPLPSRLSTSVELRQRWIGDVRLGCGSFAAPGRPGHAVSIRADRDLLSPAMAHRVNGQVDRCQRRDASTSPSAQVQHGPSAVAEAHPTLGHRQQHLAESVGDERSPAMSAVAVCCSSASLELAVALLQLLEQPGVLDGDDGLVGERLQQRDLRAVNGRASSRMTASTPIGSPLRSSGTLDWSDAPIRAMRCRAASGYSIGIVGM